MTIKGNYVDSFKKNSSVPWVCPSCQKAFLTIQQETFRREHTRESRRSQTSQETYGPENMEFKYSCFLVCSNSSCKEVVVSCGRGFFDPEPERDEDGEWDNNWQEYFKPEFFTPHLKIFSVPKNCPASVDKEINSSFSLFFCSPSSSGNHIRKAIENLLDHLKIARYAMNKGKRTSLTLHKRIEMLPTKYSHIKDLLFAIKWLGNAGSHDTLSTKDVMDSYKLTERVLEELFDNRAAEVVKLAKAINKKKGPVKKKNKSTGIPWKKTKTP